MNRMKDEKGEFDIGGKLFRGEDDIKSQGQVPTSNAEEKVEPRLLTADALGMTDMER